jgi:hypothetical protein
MGPGRIRHVMMPASVLAVCLLLSCGEGKVDKAQNGTKNGHSQTAAVRPQQEPIRYLWERTPTPRKAEPLQAASAPAARPSPGPGAASGAGTGQEEPSAAPRTPGAVSPEGAAQPVPSPAPARSPGDRTTRESPGQSPGSLPGRPQSPAAVQSPAPRPGARETSGGQEAPRARATQPAASSLPAESGSGSAAVTGDQGEAIPPDARESTPSSGRPEDIEAPVVQAIAIEPQNVQAGQRVRISVEAVDAMSGVKSVSGIFASPSGKASIPFNCQLDLTTGLYVSEITIPEKSEEGNWFVKTLSVSDTANNQYHYMPGVDPILAAAFFSVASPQSDSEPPVFNSIAFEPASIEDGGTVIAKVAAEDAMSGIKGIFGSVKSPSGTASLSFSCRLNPESGLYEGAFKIPEKAEFGTWTLKYLRLVDEANNMKNVYPGEPGTETATLDVHSSQSDAKPPEITQVIVSPRAARTGETITVQIRAIDDLSGVRSVMGWVRNPAMTARISFTCLYDPTTDYYTGQFKLPDNAESGRWFVDSIYVYDKANNRRFYKFGTDAELADAVVEVR